VSVKDWRPDREPPRQRGDVKNSGFGNLGDANPLDYEGLIVYELWDDDLYYVEAEYWNAPEYDSGPYWVYRFSVDDDVFMDLSWVKDWDRVARYAGILSRGILEGGEIKRPPGSSASISDRRRIPRVGKHRQRPGKVHPRRNGKALA